MSQILKTQASPLRKQAAKRLRTFHSAETEEVKRIQAMIKDMSGFDKRENLAVDTQPLHDAALKGNYSLRNSGG